MHSSNYSHSLVILNSASYSKSSFFVLFRLKWGKKREDFFDNFRSELIFTYEYLDFLRLLRCCNSTGEPKSNSARRDAQAHNIYIHIRYIYKYIYCHSLTIYLHFDVFHVQHYFIMFSTTKIQHYSELIASSTRTKFYSTI